ncbi:MAG TPA: hypothetical protein VM433_08450 [Mycobacteriales bacterium]|nr:hypothetical protein [Mycobacteriales bacterium]
MLTRLSDAAERLDRAAQPWVLDPLARLDTLAAARLLPLLAAVRSLLRRALTAPADRVVEVVVDWVLPPSASGAPAHAVSRPGLRDRLASSTRGIALASAVVMLAGFAALALTAPTPAPQVAVQAAVETQDRPGPWSVHAAQPGAARHEARPAPPDLALPSPAAPPAPTAAVPLAQPAPEPVVEPPAARWLPTGTGMWLHDWVRSEGGEPAAVVARAQASGLSHLYVQTGSSRKGWIGDEVLGQLLPATTGTGIKVIAWDFPKLIDPEADARRMAYAAWVQVPGAPRVAAVAPDVETAAEGTHLSADAVSRYYATLRAELPPHVAVLATVPWPSEKRTGFYPYAETAVHSDAFVPMAYWYNRDPEVVTATSMQWLAQYGLPVMPAGQGYDGRIDAPHLPEDPDPAGSVQAFVDAARAGGARSISLWSWQTTGPLQWDVLVRAGTGTWPPAG